MIALVEIPSLVTAAPIIASISLSITTWRLRRAALRFVGFLDDIRGFFLGGSDARPDRASTLQWLLEGNAIWGGELVPDHDRRRSEVSERHRNPGGADGDDYIIPRFSRHESTASTRSSRSK